MIDVSPTMRGALILLVAGSLVLAAGCKKEGACDSQLDCIEADESGFDLIWTCVEEQCAEIPCEDSTDCELFQHCETLPAEVEGVEPPSYCADACAQDSDCPAGTRCNNGMCEDRPCRNGHLDCELAEVCSGGVCVEAGFPFCNSCQPQQNIMDQGSDSDPCDTTVTGHPFCGDGNFCWNLPNGPSCGVPCTTNSDCPGGFSCSQALLSGPQCPGDVIVVGKFCVSDFCFDPF